LVGHCSAGSKDFAENECIFESHARPLGHVGRRRVCGVPDEHDVPFGTWVHGHFFDWGEMDNTCIHEPIDERRHGPGEVRE
jgi:hypothetical protein